LDTLSHSIPQPEELGLGPAEGEGMFASIIAGFVDALKARLTIEINDLTIHVQHPRSGAFILSLATISFLPHEEKLTERVLSMSGIEAYLQHIVEMDDIGDDNVSVSSASTITSPSTSHRRNSSFSGDHGLSESMMFSPQQAESLYMSAYSQPAGQSTYINTASIHQNPLLVEEPTPEEPETPATPNKGFRFFYFEEDLIFHVASSESTANPTIKSRPVPILQSAIPTAHLFLNPQVNILPSISLISTILSLAPAPSSTEPIESSDDTGGIDFSWLGGVIIHFGSESSSQTIAHLSDWKVTKEIGKESLSISIGSVEILSARGHKILSLEKSGRLEVLLLPESLEVSVPELQIVVDIGGVGELQPLVKAMKEAWLESLQQQQQQCTTVPSEEDEDWSENLIVEKIGSSTPTGRTLQIRIARISVQLQTDDGTIQFSIDEIDTQTHHASNMTFGFTGATISIPSVPNPLLTISKSDSGKSIVDFVSTGRRQQGERGFLINGAQEILDDFLVGDTSRSDDAWGMIRADASNNSTQFIKLTFPHIAIQVSDSTDIDAVKKVLSKIQNTMKMFMEDVIVPVESEREDDQIDLVVEFALEEGKLGIKLDEGEMFEGYWGGIEGTLVSGVAGGELVGVVDVTKLRVDVTSPTTPRKILHESIHRVHFPKVSS
jgi:hypothetical protein